MATYDAIAGEPILYNIENTGYYRDCDFGCVGKLPEPDLLQIKQTVFSDQLLHTKINQVCKCLTDFFETNMEDDFVSQLNFEISIIKPNQYSKHIVSAMNQPFDNIIK